MWDVSLTDLSLQTFLKTTFLGLMLEQIEGSESAKPERKKETQEHLIMCFLDLCDMTK